MNAWYSDKPACMSVTQIYINQTEISTLLTMTNIAEHENNNDKN